MRNGNLISFLGWITAISFGLAILNFFIKYINKKYISKLGKEKKKLVDMYRKVMRIIVKNHKLVGTIAIVSVLTHFFIAFSSNRISITGVIAALIMATIFCLGFYGAYINKNYKGMWLKVHRALAFSLIIAIVIHIV
ncbi:hypothetical protein G9F71_009375 [Clostridium sp. FP2]|uniref:hypothetical protein n=1 Tax=Clostridium TaxID=1485 RepID=UPI0013E947AA|nr:MULTISPECIES: hypothetical protein [Clostridium]MBW9157150.1 hypothetical protein [Clostridium tagluense]MBZ9623065.1 hypothetical protein [Clostridium sp. FP2]WLC67244.1 hypothetical protein KTC93_08725 [Clostridium tagluense]